MITAGLYKICTQTLIRSINSVSAASDKLGHSCKAGLPCSWRIHPEEECAQLLMLPLRREEKKKKKRMKKKKKKKKEEERGGWTRRRIVAVWVVEGAFLKCVYFMFADSAVAQDRDQQRVSPFASAL